MEEMLPQIKDRGRRGNSMETEEVFISGYCRTANRTNTVCCEYEAVEGKRTLVFMDCVFDRCEHHAACLIYKEALANQD